MTLQVASVPVLSSRSSGPLARLRSLPLIPREERLLVRSEDGLKGGSLQALWRKTRVARLAARCLGRGKEAGRCTTHRGKHAQDLQPMRQGRAPRDDEKTSTAGRSSERNRRAQNEGLIAEAHLEPPLQHPNADHRAWRGNLRVAD